MKTKIFTMLAIAAAMASCSKDDVVNIGADNANYNMIGFATYTSQNHTKGIPVASSDAFNSAGSTFDVAAYINIDGADVSEAYLNATINYDGTNSKWIYAPSSTPQLWPSDATQTLDFYAYTNASAGNTIKTSKAGGIFMDTPYAVPTDITAQKDFMYAAAAGVENVSGTNANIITKDAVNMHFRHALTQINFTAQVLTDDITVAIEKIELCKINSKGEFAVASKANTSVASAAVCSWANQSALDTYAVAPTAAVAVTKATSTTKAVEINDSNAGHELMLVPQTFAEWDGASKAADQDNAYILVTCTLYKTMTDDNGNPVLVYYIGDKNGAGVTAIPVASTTGEGNNSTSPEWIGGRNITYNLIFSADPTKPGGGKDPETGDPTLVPISFTATVENWVDVTPSTDVEM